MCLGECRTVKLQDSGIHEQLIIFAAKQLLQPDIFMPFAKEVQNKNLQAMHADNSHYLQMLFITFHWQVMEP